MTRVTKEETSQFKLMFPTKLRDQIEAIAVRERRSVSQQIIRILEDHVARCDAGSAEDAA